MTIETSPKANAKIVEILRISSNLLSLYAAQRIEELEAEVERLRRILEETGLWAILEEAGLAEPEPAPDTPPRGRPRGHAITDRIGITIQRRSDADCDMNMINFCKHPRSAMDRETNGNT